MKLNYSYLHRLTTVIYRHIKLAFGEIHRRSTNIYTYVFVNEIKLRIV